MSHSQLIMRNAFAGSLLQIGDQIGQEQILQLTALLADQMTVGHRVAVVAVGLSGDGEPPDLPLGSQLIQIAVNCAHGDAGHLCPSLKEDLFGSEVIVDICQNLTDQHLLFGHLFTSLQNQELFLFL